MGNVCEWVRNCYSIVMVLMHLHKLLGVNVHLVASDVFLQDTNWSHSHHHCPVSVTDVVELLFVI